MSDAPAPPHPPDAYRLEAVVELKQPPSPAKGIDWLAWMQALTPIVIAVVGWLVTDAVKTGLERQQLQLANASGMRELLVKLLQPDTTQADARATTSTLAAFGAPAVAPLVAALLDADEIRTPAIESGLRAIGLNAPASVCTPLTGILENRTGRFSWLVYKSAVRVIGDVGCPDARPVLARYESALRANTLKAFDPQKEAWSELSAEHRNQLRADVERALGNEPPP